MKAGITAAVGITEESGTETAKPQTLQPTGRAFPQMQTALWWRFSAGFLNVLIMAHHSKRARAGGQALS